MKVVEVIDKVNTNDVYWSLYEFEEKFKTLKLVASDLNVDRHRWYELSTNVYKCDDGYVGINGIAQCFDECSSPVDMDCPCYAEEYEAIPSITYKPKKSE